MKVGDVITGYLFGNRSDPREAEIVAVFHPEPEGLPYTVVRPGFYFIVTDAARPADEMVWFHQSVDVIKGTRPGSNVIALAQERRFLRPGGDP